MAEDESLIAEMRETLRGDRERGGRHSPLLDPGSDPLEPSAVSPELELAAAVEPVAAAPQGGRLRRLFQR